MPRMASKRAIVTTLLVSLSLGPTGCSGARSILRGQSPDDEARAPAVPAARAQAPRRGKIRLPHVKMTDDDRRRLEFSEEQVRKGLAVAVLVPLAGALWLLDQQDLTEADWFGPQSSPGGSRTPRRSHHPHHAH